MAADLNRLTANVNEILTGKIVSLENKLGELTLVIAAADMIRVLTQLRDHPALRFEQLIDLCGVDYSTYGSDICEGGAYFSSEISSEPSASSGASAPAPKELGFSSDITYAAGLVSDEIGQSGVVLHGAMPKPGKARFAAVYHLLSHTHNVRLRVRVFAPDDDMPVLDSVAEIWPCANWFEREAFDLYGIIFSGHPDLRRLLTDYGFVGNPFRKDFPLSGHVEMRYDPEQQRVIYQPVSIEPREVTPRIVREEKYAYKR